MDKYSKHNYNSPPGDNNRYTSRSERDHNPSFSSTLLDQIYHSIDETNDHHVADDDEFVLYRGTAATMKKKKQYVHTTVETKDEANFQRIEKWMEKKKARENTINTREKSAASDHIYQRKNDKKYSGIRNLNSSWSSSDSSSGGLFSSEADSNYGVSSRSSSTAYRPKPIRTRTDVNKTHAEKRNQESDGVVKRSKLKALKIYGDLKNMKQPISPGAKLASFLNSLFATGGSVKKGKISGAISSNNSPACSTSRSCLSKTPSTRGKYSDSGTKRSVQFNPVSVIVDEDCQPCGHKSLQRGQGGQDLAVPDQRISVNEELIYHIRTKNQSVEEATRDLLKNYETKVESEDDDDDDDDNASCASSDLFELDSLNSCGINVRGNYMEELPVFETTNYLDTNLAIAD